MTCTQGMACALASCLFSTSPVTASWLFLMAIICNCSWSFVAVTRAIAITAAACPMWRLDVTAVWRCLAVMKRPFSLFLLGAASPVCGAVPVVKVIAPAPAVAPPLPPPLFLFQCRADFNSCPVLFLLWSAPRRSFVLCLSGQRQTKALVPCYLVGCGDFGLIALCHQRS